MPTTIATPNTEYSVNNSTLSTQANTVLPIGYIDTAKKLNSDIAIALNNLNENSNFDIQHFNEQLQILLNSLNAALDDTAVNSSSAENSAEVQTDAAVIELDAVTLAVKKMATIVQNSASQ